MFSHLVEGNMSFFKKEKLFLRLCWIIAIVSFINGQDVDENNKFQEFVQIQRINGSLLCGGVIIDTQFVITAAACLRGHFAERHIKDIASDGLKIIVSEYKSPNGLGLVQFQPEYKGDVLQIAQEEPGYGDKCKLLGWDIDSEGNPYQLANEINFTANFLEEVSHVQIGSVCESMTVKVLICKGRLQNFIVRSCVNGQAEYSSIDILSQNGWINNIYECYLHKSEGCKLEEETDYVSTTSSSTNVFPTHEESTFVEESTTTTSSFSSTPSTTIQEHITTVPEISDRSKSDKTKPIALITWIAIGIFYFI